MDGGVARWGVQLANPNDRGKLGESGTQGPGRGSVDTGSAVLAFANAVCWPQVAACGRCCGDQGSYPDGQGDRGTHRVPIHRTPAGSDSVQKLRQGLTLKMPDCCQFSIEGGSPKSAVFTLCPYLLPPVAGGFQGGHGER